MPVKLFCSVAYTFRMQDANLELFFKLSFVVIRFFFVAVGDGLLEAKFKECHRSATTLVQ